MKKNIDLLKKLELETTNVGVVHLWLEGMFWKAYEKSAYLFVQRISGYKPYKRFVHAAGGEVLAIGFPSKAFARVTDGRTLEQVDEKHCIMSGFNVDRNEMKGYYEWKQNVPSFPYAVVATQEQQPATVSEEHAPVPVKPRKRQTPPPVAPVPAPVSVVPEIENSLANELRRFRMESATPLDCMVFLAHLIKVACAAQSEK